MNWIAWALVPALLAALWLYTAQISRSFPLLRRKRICILIAHPDDEAMFFAPAVIALTRAELRNHVQILCLSSGNADGLGETRKKELVKSAMILGLRNEDDVTVIDDPNFPDSMTTTWHPRLLSNLLTTRLAPRMCSLPSTSPPQASIDVLVTFDPRGVSAHPNHISLHTGAVTFLRSLVHRHREWDCPVALYALTSTGIARKYAGVLDAPATVLAEWLSRRAEAEGGVGVKEKQKEKNKENQEGYPAQMVFVSGLDGWRTARRAMTEAHRSQMVWFRWGWITLGRYMVVNDLRLEKAL